jgi:hypothetical protein
MVLVDLARNALPARIESMLRRIRLWRTQRRALNSHPR